MKICKKLVRCCAMIVIEILCFQSGMVAFELFLL